ncbi:MAG: enoyl-CoA hydratase-related protein [Dehalococcoidia bacterium]
MSELVHYELTGGVGRITLDSPPNRNALSRQLTAELAAHMDAAVSDPAARIILLTGTGGVFCSGADLKEQRDANQSGGNTGPTALAPILEAMWNAPKPVVGRINGAARAGGMGLVAACDIAIGVESATFAVNEVRIGVIPAIISVVLLRKLSVTHAMEIFLTGEPFMGSRAVEIGLLNSAVHSDDLDKETDRYLAMLKQGAPGALGGAKRLVREVAAMEMHAGFEAMAELSAKYFASPEALEGMTAFAERRPPAWAPTPAE